jgi:adenylate cyclase
MSSPPPRVPPLSVRDRLLRDAEIEAERTVSVLRAVIAAALVGLLAVSLASMAEPPPEVIRHQIGVAVAVLVAYLALGLVSLRLARPGRLEPWMPWVFTTADAGLILFNIAFNADNLGVSLAFATVFPVVWLAPLILSFTALRYRPGLQAYSGALLVGGVLALALVEGAAPSGPMPPAESFAAPPNLMRLAMLAGCAAVLVVAAGRRRALLTRAVEESARRAEYQRYLPPPVAELVARGEIERLRRGWRTEAAILMVDIRGFTALCERLAPEALGRLVTAYRGRLGAIVEAHGGIVDKFVGDGAVVLFGVVEGRADEAAAALACAEALVSGLGEVAGQPLRLAIGAHWGEVVAGAVGGDDRLDFTALGDAVNVAARLEEVAKLEDRPLVVSEALLDAAGERADVRWRHLDVHTLRGRTRPVELFAPRRSAVTSASTAWRNSSAEPRL